LFSPKALSVQAQPFISSGHSQVPFPSGSKSPGLKAASPIYWGKFVSPYGRAGGQFCRPEKIGRPMPGIPGSPAPAAGQKREPSRSGPAGEEGTFFCFPSFPSAGDSRLFSKRQALDPAFPVKEERGFHPPQDG